MTYPYWNCLASKMKISTQNKAKALKILRARVYESEKRKKIYKGQKIEEIKLELEIDRKELEPIIFLREELQTTE